MSYVIYDMLASTVYSVHCTLYTVHCTLYIVHCTLYTVHCTLYIVYKDIEIWNNIVQIDLIFLNDPMKRMIFSI